MTHGRPVFCIAVTIVLALFFLPTHAQAQQAAATTGVIRGVVLNPDGAPVPGARVEVVNRETSFTRVVEADSDGRFAATNLPVGLYDVSATSNDVIGDVQRGNLRLRLGETLDLQLVFTPIEAEAIVAIGEAQIVDPTDVTASQRFDEEVLEGLPNNGRNFLRYTTLTPGVGVVQGPDGDEITISGQRGIFNNVIVDGADFNNPFFGEQRGGQRPAFTFNLDAVEEIVVVNQGATAEFGRSAGGFINVLTKSGTNELEGSVHYFGQNDGLSSDFPLVDTPIGTLGGNNPDFYQHQFGFTLGGPLAKDRAFFFFAYDQQEFESTKQTSRTFPEPAEFQRLQNFLSANFGGVLEDDFGPIVRTNDNKALIAKLDVILNQTNNASFKYNYTDTEQVNGTFDVDFWGRSSNAVEQDESHAFNASLFSQLSSTVSNEVRFQYAQEDRPRPYDGPINPNTGRPFPDTAMSFDNNIRFGMPFFIPVIAQDIRWQVLDNMTLLRGDHLFKVGGEYNFTEEDQTFIGFANGRFIFDSVDGFINFVNQGPNFRTCSDGSSVIGQCPEGTETTGPLLLYLQFAPVPPLTTPEQAGNQKIGADEVAFFVQDTWTASPNLTVNYGVRWEAQIQPDPITDPSDVFYADFIGQTVNGQEFPSDGTIPSDYDNIQPRFGFSYDVKGDGKSVVRANSGLFYSRVPGLIFASARSTNGSIGQTLAASSFFGAPPAYGELIPTAGLFPFGADVFVVDKDFENPRTWSTSFEWEQLVSESMAVFTSYTYARTDDLFRFINRNDAVFGSPWSTGLPNSPNDPGDRSNGIFTLTTLESTAKSRYHGWTIGLKGSVGDALQMEANYTLSQDKSDDDNERDPFSFRYARADDLDPEFGLSDRDQRHRFNAYFLTKLPGQFFVNNTISAASAQPISERCINNQPSGERIVEGQGDRICGDGTILERNTIRRDNDFFQWDLRVSRPFAFANGSQVELIAEVFNLFDNENFADSTPTALLFNFDGTIANGLKDPRRVQLGARLRF